MLLAGLAAVVHDYRWVHRPVKAVVAFFKKKREVREEEGVDMVECGVQGVEARPPSQAPRGSRDDQGSPTPPDRSASVADEPRFIPTERRLSISWKLGLGVILAFLASFIVVMVLRGVLPQKPLLYRLFANMYLVGTIILVAGQSLFRCCVSTSLRRGG